MVESTLDKWKIGKYEGETIETQCFTHTEGIFGPDQVYLLTIFKNMSSLSD